MIVNVPVLNMYEGDHVTSQALFGEKVEVLSPLIRTPDGYEGTADLSRLVAGEYTPDLETGRSFCHVYAGPAIETGPLLTLPFGVGLKKIQDVDERWVEVSLPDGSKAYIQRGDLLAHSEVLRELAMRFLGLPYTWGGRSSFGYDCSGFTQAVMARFGCRLPRDAYQQAELGREVDTPQEGDLLFWGDQKKIKHVGISLGGIDFIHTSSRENKPYLRLSRSTDPAWNRDAVYPIRFCKRVL